MPARTQEAATLHAGAHNEWTAPPPPRGDPRPGRAGRSAPRLPWLPRSALGMAAALSLLPAAWGEGGPVHGWASAQARGAAPETTLAVVDFQVGEQRFDKAVTYAQRVEDELSGTRFFTVLPSADAARTLKAGATGLEPVDAEAVGRLAQRLREVEDLIYSRPRRAIKRLKALSVQLDEALGHAVPDDAARALYFRLHIKLARAFSDLGKEAETRAIMRQMLGFLGTATVTEDNYHPKVVALWRETVAHAAKAPHASLRVSSVPAGLPVRINGRLLAGVTPLMLGALTPGAATVSVRSPRGDVSRRVSLAAGETAIVNIDVDRTLALRVRSGRVGLRFPDADTYHRRAAALAADVGRRLHVDRVLLCGLVRKDDRVFLTGLLVNCSTGKIGQRKELYTKPNVISRLRVQQLAGFFQGVFIETEMKPWYTSWLGWTGVGVAVAGAVAGPLLWGQYESALTDVRCTKGPPTCKTEAQRALLAGDAKTYRALGGTGFVLAGLGVAAAVIGFVWVRDEELAEEPETASGSPSPRLRALTPTLLPGGTPGLAGVLTF